ncbi:MULTISPECIES: ABC transporter permease [Streptococcus]|jgi:ABC superfamily ATP binding cassette transporter, membrane protein|uniref:ABC transporter permease n=1 Tax=Streptococcus sanguinis TaxID=1305 RepID=A0AAJ5NJA5_STRSA|nr:ABC transporter permease [Streptococcus sanguinis]MBF1707761.1 ABC transporter permease [Streptococcus sanguinis]MBZ2023248.1 ABC transporter permease [Streptococcus sanguinis]MBZ2048078.1 ABC transporter permease [Streptococcus sanguinis]MBZ2050537.1 ABC transporter permease [Streptococcus sanguinis]MBZ2059515.1 ABC transporter permease [Streptococcus sanguinis]
MRLTFLLKSLFKSLSANKRQSLLTIGSLVIGVVSLLLVLSLGNGVGQSIVQQLNSVTGGRKTFTINCTNYKDGAGFTENDRQRLMGFANIQNVELSINPQLNTVSVHLLGDRSMDGSVVNYDQLSSKYNEKNNDIKVISGKALSEIQQSNGNEIAIKDTASKKLFPTTSSEGELVSIGGDYYKISAVYQGSEETPDLLVTEKMFLRNTSYRNHFNQAKIKYRGSKSKAEKQVLKYLERYGSSKKKGVYEIEDLHQVVGQINRTTSLATNLIAGVAGISLIVAGFGVMSATYSSVAGRKSEIGLRRAFGAKKSSIRNQFIVEGLFLAFISSFISVVFVLVISQLLGNSMGVRLIVTRDNILTAVLVPSVICFIFTYFPAVSASRKNVLNLLR